MKPDVEVLLAIPARSAHWPVHDMPKAKGLIIISAAYGDAETKRQALEKALRRFDQAERLWNASEQDRYAN